MSTPIRVLVVDDQHIVRKGIRSLLALSDEVAVVGDCADGDAALTMLAQTPVDVLLLDLQMPVRDGIATLEAMRERGIEVPTLVLTTFDDDEIVLSALRAGARGYLLKDVTLEQLLSGVRALATGGTLLHPAMTSRLLASSPSPRRSLEPPHPTTPLSERELDVLRLAAAGWSNRQIARGLHLAEGTVKNRMSSVLLKLGAPDRTNAVLRALESGLLTGSAHPLEG
ncbi:response regulator [Agrococcus baldri]|uniref:DNA-binding response regulator n=1 Tax=Agrococcus baldri TaxID=153730 RepID=A0AA87UR73_9MICO|nr:response regulator transcription factor [Agrococcus baldri]GEK79423.1 DNA-binding response regulator [Agrococcus baldri]